MTVDRKDGGIRRHNPIRSVTDLPGIYSHVALYQRGACNAAAFCSMSSRDGIINIVDATNIERNLYLTMQLMELDIPMVLALNMMDEVRENGGTIRRQRAWRKMLGIPVIPISAAKNEGIDELIEHALHVAQYQEKPGRHGLLRSRSDDGGAVHRCLHGVSCT